jgi:hypothetical protein
VQLAGVTRRVSAQAPGTWFAALTATCLAVTAAVWVAGPVSWQSLINATQETDATVATALGIWITNFLVVAVPVVAAAFAYGARANGKARLGRWLIVFATATLFRNPIAVGFVGGLDPAWFVGVWRWWLFELAAISMSCATMWRVWYAADIDVARRLLRAGLVCCAGLLALGAVIEVALT